MPYVGRYGGVYDHPPTAKEMEINRLKKLEIPNIITQPKLNTDPCIDDIDPQVENTSGTVKSIMIGLVIGFILLKLVK